ncbi:uncharacterized protein ATNIH1004_002630 [Aspergillus tanneri]|uniref:Uncharacterized protein n=1 Tax=Aspergillus tanneri TaxID=1220188 RepID=A0A5M9MS68_9EURO|nr:uncharacterized protein ATNIH1004_002630 [Aspergillus tanneri]KAA8649951.1 hypothetical protein ATNIH1004_002630 [Aspergillus tanneri]
MALPARSAVIGLPCLTKMIKTHKLPSSVAADSGGDVLPSQKDTKVRRSCQAMPTERLLPSTQNKSANEEVEQDDPVKVLEKQATFDEIVVWGHEAVPASDDTFVKGVEEWAKMAKVMHSLPSNERASQ